MDREMLGRFIARRRKEKGLTQRELDQSLHVTDKAVSRWERGIGCPDVMTLEPLAAALGLTPYGLQKKINNQTEFKASEILTLSEVLHLSEKERNAIFFAKKRDL